MSNYICNNCKKGSCKIEVKFKPTLCSYKAKVETKWILVDKEKENKLQIASAADKELIVERVGTNLINLIIKE